MKIINLHSNYSYSVLQNDINALKSSYPFLEVSSAGVSVLGKSIPVIKIGNGLKEVFYSAAMHRK